MRLGTTEEMRLLVHVVGACVLCAGYADAFTLKLAASGSTGLRKRLHASTQARSADITRRMSTHANEQTWAAPADVLARVAAMEAQEAAGSVTAAQAAPAVHAGAVGSQFAQDEQPIISEIRSSLSSRRAYYVHVHCLWVCAA